MLVIGLTGGIASGKSLVSRILEQGGCRIIDADIVGHQVMEPGLPAYEDIVEYFGLGILDNQGRINRKVLGQIVFSDSEKLKVLNSISHPRILERIRQILRELKAEESSTVVVIEAALLFEIQLDTLVDEVWTVETDPEIQVQRLMERNGCSEEMARQRIKTQMPAKDRMAKAHKVICNKGGEEELVRKVMATYESTVSGIPYNKSTYYSGID